VLDKQRPENVLRGVVGFAAQGVAFGELHKVGVDQRKDSWIVEPFALSHEIAGL
jgi:hypothetical protein